MSYTAGSELAVTESGISQDIIPACRETPVRDVLNQNTAPATVAVSALTCDFTSQGRVRLSVCWLPPGAFGAGSVGNASGNPSQNGRRTASAVDLGIGHGSSSPRRPFWLGFPDAFPTEPAPK